MLCYVVVLEESPCLRGFKSLSLSSLSSNYKSSSSSSSLEVQVLDIFRGLSRLTQHAKYQAPSSCSDWVTNGWLDLPLCPGRVQVHVNLTVLPHRSVVVVDESPCPWGPIFKSSSLSSSLDIKSLSLSSSLVLDNNTAYYTGVWTGIATAFQLCGRCVGGIALPVSLSLWQTDSDRLTVVSYRWKTPAFVSALNQINKTFVLEVWLPVPVLVHVMVTHSNHICYSLLRGYQGGSLSASPPPPFRPGNPALCGSHPIP